MANVNAPFGFVPIGTTDGSDYHAKARDFFITAGSSGAIQGDPVFISSSSTDPTGKYQKVETGDTGAKVSGNFVGVIAALAPNFADEDFINSGLASAETGIGSVYTGNEILYTAQNLGVSVAVDDSSKSGDILYAPSVNGQSQAQINVTAVTASATRPVTLLHLHDTPNNVLGVNSIWVCILQNIVVV